MSSTSPRWTSDELADLNDTITTARSAGNTELADYWQSIRDGHTPTTDWESLRVGLYARHGIDVSAT